MLESHKKSIHPILNKTLGISLPANLVAANGAVSNDTGTSPSQEPEAKAEAASLVRFSDERKQLFKVRKTWRRQLVIDWRRWF